MKQARILESADAELDEAVTYFDARVAGLGDRFQREVEITISRILEYPEIGSPLTKRIRKSRVRKFKYNVIYIIDSDEILIIAVAHHKKRPRYWRDRIARMS